MSHAVRSALTMVMVIVMVMVSRSAWAKGGDADERPEHAVLLLPLESEGLLAPDHDALESKLRSAFDHPEIELTALEVAPKQECSAEPCLRALGRERGATHVVRVVLAGDGRDYVGQIEVLMVDHDGPASTIDTDCSICGLAELGDRLAGRAVAAREQILARPRAGRLRIIGQPIDARIRIDGRSLGRLPYAAELATGEHELVIKARGHYRQVVPLATVAGVEEIVEVELAPKPVLGWHRPVGWVAFVGGVTSLGAGAALIGIDGRPAVRRCNAGPPGIIDGDGDCRWLHRSSGLGVGLTIAGVALATTGITLLAIDARRRRANEPATALSPRVRAGVGVGRLDLHLHF